MRVLSRTSAPLGIGSQEQPWCDVCRRIRVALGDPVRLQDGASGQREAIRRMLRPCTVMESDAEQNAVRWRWRGEGRTVETAQQLPGSFCEGAGAICSVGGRFIAWQAAGQEASLKVG